MAAERSLSASSRLCRKRTRASGQGLTTRAPAPRGPVSPLRQWKAASSCHRQGWASLPPQMCPPSDPGPVTSLKWEQDYNFPLQISDRTNCSLRQKPRLSVPQTRSGEVPANAALAQGTDLVGEAEALGELAHLAQGCQVLIQAADGLLDGLPIGGLRRPWQGQRKAMDT